MRWRIALTTLAFFGCSLHALGQQRAVQRPDGGTIAASQIDEQRQHGECAFGQGRWNLPFTGDLCNWQLSFWSHTWRFQRRREDRFSNPEFCR